MQVKSDYELTIPSKIELTRQRTNVSVKKMQRTGMNFQNASMFRIKFLRRKISLPWDSLV